MARQSDSRADSRLELLDTLKSTGFWSVIGGIAGVLATLVGLVLFLTIDELRNFAVSVLIIGLVLLFVALVLSPRAVAVFMAGRQGRYGANVALMAVAFFAIVILLNFLLYRTPTRVDVTSTRVFSLAQQSIQVLEGLSGPVRANAFFAPTDTNAVFARQQTEDLLNEFSRRSPDFTYRFIDPELNRTTAVQYDVTDTPVIVFEDIETGRQQSVFSPTEQDFVTGILIATGAEQKRVYFLTGHQEASITRDLGSGEVDDDGFDFALQGMQRDNYDVRPLNLKQSGFVPQDAAVLLIPGPKSNLDEEELTYLTDYLLRGGKIVLLLDPKTPDSYQQLMVPWGLQVAQLPVADLISNVAGEATSPLIQKANAQFVTSGLTDVPITDKLNVVFLTDATAVLPSIPPEDLPLYITYYPLARTTAASWLETNPEEVDYQPGEDAQGQFDVAAVVEAGGNLAGQFVTTQGGVAKILVIGDSDFAKNRFFFSSDNADLLLNSINYLADDYELIAIRPKLVPFRELVVNTRERDFIKWSSWFVPPSLMLIIGIVVWWRRR